MSQILFEGRSMFRWILKELNYGELEKDERIIEIGNDLKIAIKQAIDKNEFDGQLQVKTKSKFKDDIPVKIIILWEITTPYAKMPTFFLYDSDITFLSRGGDSTTFFVKLLTSFIHSEGLSDKKFKEKIDEFFDSNEIDKMLYHEVKHILDGVDEIYSKGNYYIPKDNSDKEYIKYFSQNKEIDAHLVSVLMDIDRIIKEEPTISLTTALQNSRSYQSFVKYIHPSKLNKYKQKIIHFWNEQKGDNIGNF